MLLIPSDLTRGTPDTTTPKNPAINIFPERTIVLSYCRLYREVQNRGLFDQCLLRALLRAFLHTACRRRCFLLMALIFHITQLQRYNRYSSQMNIRRRGSPATKDALI